MEGRQTRLTSHFIIATIKLWEMLIYPYHLSFSIQPCWDVLFLKMQFYHCLKQCLKFIKQHTSLTELHLHLLGWNVIRSHPPTRILIYKYLLSQFHFTILIVIYQVTVFRSTLCYRIRYSRLWCWGGWEKIYIPKSPLHRE